MEFSQDMVALGSEGILYYCEFEDSDFVKKLPMVPPITDMPACEGGPEILECILRALAKCGSTDIPRVRFTMVY